MSIFTTTNAEQLQTPEVPHALVARAHIIDSAVSILVSSFDRNYAPDIQSVTTDSTDIIRPAKDAEPAVQLSNSQLDVGRVRSDIRNAYTD